MAKRTITNIYDDIDGTEGADTVKFSYDGKSYEIDLSDKNKEKLAKALEPFISAGRSVSGSRRSGAGGSGRSSNKAELQKIRGWANSNGHSVSDRGRIASSIVEAYEAANK